VVGCAPAVGQPVVFIRPLGMLSFL
jgi:hypothetical protein